MDLTVTLQVSVKSLQWQDHPLFFYISNSHILFTTLRLLLHNNTCHPYGLIVNAYLHTPLTHTCVKTVNMGCFVLSRRFFWLRLRRAG